MIDSGRRAQELSVLRSMRSMEAMIARYVALLVVVFGVVVAGFYELNVLNAKARAIDGIQVDTRRALRLQLDEESGLRGYDATGERLFLKPYNEAQPQLTQLIATLSQRMLDEPHNLALLTDFTHTHATWAREIAGPVLRNPYDPANDRRERAGKALVDRMRADINHISASYDFMAAEVAARTRTVALTAETLIVVSILAIAALGYYMERRSSVREERLFSTVMETRDRATRMSDWQAKVMAMLAHDFKSTLAAVRGYTDLLEDFPERRADSQPYRGIRQATQELAHMADDALLMARFSHGQLSIDPRPIAIWDVVNDAAERYRGDRIVTITDSSEIVMGERDYLRRVFDNLISNAVKYSPADALVNIDIARSESGEIEVSVHDRGCGISVDDLPHLFQEYWRSSSAPKGAGSGIGLFVVKKIVDAPRRRSRSRARSARARPSPCASPR